MAKTLAKALEKLFFGSVGGTATIQNAVSNAPDDTVVARQLALGSQQPLRLVGVVVLNGSDPEDSTLTIEFNNLGGTPVLSWSSTGIYTISGSNLFKGTVLEKLYSYFTVGSLLVKKTNDSVINLYSRDENGTLTDGLFIYSVAQQIQIEVIPN